MSRPGAEDAAEVVAGALRRRPPAERHQYLRELLAHVAAGLVVTAGDRCAAEDIYKIADAVVAKAER